MRNIYSCIDIGSHSIKLVVMEKLEDKFVVLSRFITRSKGVSKGIIVSEEEALGSIRKAVNSVQDELGIKIKKLMCLLETDDVEFLMLSGSCKIKNHKVGYETISDCLEGIVRDNIESDREAIGVFPVLYKIDEEVLSENLIDREGKTLSLKAVVQTTKKSYIKNLVDLFKKLEIEVVDFGLGLVGDYYTFKSNKIDDAMVAVINIGYDKTDIGIFNKGIMIKTTSIGVGSKLIDRDIAMTYNLEKKKARYLKETFAISNTRYADVNDIVEIEDKNKESLEINQLKISEVVEREINDILKFAKKQINLLTKREIRYIMVTGGISELAGFEYVLDNMFGKCANVIDLNQIGVRSNSFSSCVGFVYYFDEKLKTIGKTYSMINEEELEILNNKAKKTTSESSLGSFLNYITGNKED